MRIDPELAMSAAASAGVRFFQYRNKRGSKKTIYEKARLLAQAARRAGALFLVNDHADIAAAVGADGVHLGQDDLPIEAARKLLGGHGIIGISTHSRGQAIAAEASGADYIGFGPIFATSTKDAGSTQGIEALPSIKKAVSIPVIAIGGINHTNVQIVLKAGADGAAVISAILSAPDVKQSAEQMIKCIRNA
jgi:thiamine-phosphate pyrophosphorylase